MDSINVYLDQSVTPLPLLTTETSWLGGRLIRIRGKRLEKYSRTEKLHFPFFLILAKDENKSPVRASERISVTAPPSRKASAVSNVSCNVT